MLLPPKHRRIPMNAIDMHTKELDVLARLQTIAREHAPAVLASSFGVEDMLLTDLMDRHGLAIGVFTLDTGRLPEETHRLMQQTRQRYGCPWRYSRPRPRT